MRSSGGLAASASSVFACSWADRPFGVADWQADVAQLLDEHHLSAWSDAPIRRVRFAVSLGQFLQAQRDTEVCTLYGRHITDLESFCYQLERAIPGPSLDCRIDGPNGVTSLLRTRESFPGRPATKYRYYLWHDADILLHRDRALFGRLVDAIAGVGCEAEYASDDMLLLHRAVFVGGHAIDEYASDPKGQFQQWFDDGLGDPFWKVVTDIDAPPFLRFGVDQLFDRARPQRGA